MTSLNILLLLLLLNTSSQCKKQDSVLNSSASINSVELDQVQQPLSAGTENLGLLSLKMSVSSAEKPIILNEVEITFTDESLLAGVSSVSVKYTGLVQGSVSNVLFSTSKSLSTKTILSGTHELSNGTHFLKFDFGMNSNHDLLSRFQVSQVKLSFKNHDPITAAPSQKFIFRPKLVLRAQGQDKTDTYRIPGLVTTNQGTLIAVYDNRYNNSKDLQEDIDIGMSRSTDGGQTWQPMKVIMDMGEYGGRSQQLNGIGDPCVLYDHKTNTIWVAALWMSGSAPDQMLWWASKPGIKPEETGQFMLAKSTDDGLTWSQPINITEQIKNPNWQLLLQGPGRGITLSDGTLVFPAQFKADLGEKALDGGQYTCHSTIVYSKDQGKTWHIGTGAKTNTTEAQVVQLGDGSLMLNMRDDRNRKDKSGTNGRAVATTTDLGKTWAVHPTSNSALPESNCMASIIRAIVTIKGEKRPVLFFSNPNNKNERTNMTIKASLDEGLTWPESMQIELNSASGYGYSCLTMVDENTIGIVYEGVKELYFQKVPVADFFGK